MREPLPFVPRKRLKDPRYRRELLAKVEALIAVLEAARQKILLNLGSPGVDVTRLMRVQSNLEGTLEVCQRARRTLLRASGSQAEAEAAQPPRRSARPGRMTFQDYVEVSSYEEYQRLRDQGPIQAEELETADLEELCRRLGGPDGE